MTRDDCMRLTSDRSRLRPYRVSFDVSRSRLTSFVPNSSIYWQLARDREVGRISIAEKDRPLPLPISLDGIATCDAGDKHAWFFQHPCVGMRDRTVSHAEAVVGKRACWGVWPVSSLLRSLPELMNVWSESACRV